MKNITRLIKWHAFTIIVLLASSCSNSEIKENKKDQNDTLAKAKWTNPRKGKIWEKELAYHMPYTAIEGHLFGAVKSFTFKHYIIEGAHGSKKLNDSGYCSYDRQGNLIAENGSDIAGLRQWKGEYVYGETGKLTESALSFTNPESYSKRYLKYDNKGRKVSDSTFDKNGKHKARSIYTYDDKGNETEIINYSNNDKDHSTETYTYDNRGYQIEYRLKSSNGRINMKIAVEYNAEGNVMKAMSCRDTICDGRTVVKYDNKGRHIEDTIYNMNGTIRSIARQKFDDWDNVIENMAYMADGSTIDTAKGNTFTEFEYDSHGNATKETLYQLKSGKKVMTDITEREYQYY